MKKIIILLSLLFASSAFNALAETSTQAESNTQATFKEGIHYKILPEKVALSGKKVKVLEFFWYGCPHCFSFEPFINKWLKTKPDNVEFERVPVIFRPNWEVQARAYYALNNLGVIDELHEKIFTELHVKRKPLNTLDQISAFVAKNGVDKAKFLEEYHSFSVASFARYSKKMQTNFKIEGVPSVVVNGKYLTSANMAGSYDKMITLIDFLIKKEQK